MTAIIVTSACGDYMNTRRLNEHLKVSMLNYSFELKLPEQYTQYNSWETKTETNILMLVIFLDFYKEPHNKLPHKANSRK